MLCILFSSTILRSNIARRNLITIFGEASRCTRLRVTTESNFHFFLLASHEGDNLIQIFSKLLSRGRPDETQLGAAKWLVFHHSKFLLGDPVVSDNSQHFSAPLLVFCKMTSEEWQQIFNTGDAALPGLGSDRSCESGGHYHMHTAVLERKCYTETRQKKRHALF